VDGEQAFQNELQGKMSQLLAPIPTSLTLVSIEDRLDVLDRNDKKNMQPGIGRLGMSNSCVLPPQIKVHISSSHCDIELQLGNHDLPHGLSGIIDPLPVVK
jgi:hypothetical protein